MSSVGKVALDAATPKQAIFASILYRELKEKYEVEVLAREETQTIDLLELLKTPYLKMGKYGGGTLEGKLEATIKQEAEILRHFKETGKPDVLWTHGNVSGVRVAYGLGVPIIYSNDTLHNEPVVRLTVPLASHLIIPEAYRRGDWVKYGIELEKITRFKGIEEVAWVKNLKPDREEVMEKMFGRVVDRLIVVRGTEYMACYSKGRDVDLLKILEELAKYGTVVFLPRYREEERVIEKLKNVVVPSGVPFAAELVVAADLVVGSGGTICREAALQGTPTICFYFKEAIINYLMRKGFPISYIPEIKSILEKSIRILRDPDRFRSDTSPILERMESPVPVILKYIKSYAFKP